MNNNVAIITEVIRKADEAFASSGGSSRHWVRDNFLPELEAAGFEIVSITRLSEERCLVDHAILFANGEKNCSECGCVHK